MTLESFTSIAYQWIFSSSCGPVWGSCVHRVEGDMLVKEYFESLAKRRKRVRRSAKKQPSPSVATGGTGRGRRNERHRTVPSGRIAKLAWEPPRGSWEREPFHIDGCGGDSAETLMIYITWLGGHKTRHKMDVLCKKCPQKMVVRRSGGYVNVSQERPICTENLEGLALKYRQTKRVTANGRRVED
ncbi:hypothetical protein FOC4_g10000599 [Fusarium odoratissimum]|uniref:Chromo shadow domain-containing protein n=1 Tax=Fusarium oxysporum f. sp. cubense (strain race 4) TaxID=2502994 RepID=N1RYF9_FUSC4|nr:hypothetical protein FOC4_g10000599 [Fusarium odoratissimum]